MAQMLEEAGCVISSKSVLVASNAKLGQRLVKVFAKNGIVMNQEKAPRDLGVANTAGKRRSLWMVRQRITKASARNLRIQHLVRKNKRASKLYRTGTYPAATYGHQVAGLNMTRIRKLRALASLGYAKPVAMPSQADARPLSSVCAMVLGMILITALEPRFL